MVPARAASTQRCSSRSYAAPNRSTKPGVIWPPRRPSVVVRTRCVSRPIIARAALADDLGAHLVRHAGADVDLVGDQRPGLGLEDDEHRIAGAGRRGRGGGALQHRTAMISSSSRNRATSTSWTTESRIMYSELKKSGTPGPVGAVHQQRAAQAAVGDQALQRRVLRIEAAHEADLDQRPAERGLPLHDRVRRRDVGGQRLLAEHRDPPRRGRRSPASRGPPRARRSAPRRPRGR